MSIQQEIARHKAGEITLNQIKRPQFICASDDDYIEYINYCWQFIALAQNDLSIVSFYNDDDWVVSRELSSDVGRAHGVIELCHKFLRIDYADLPKYVQKVFTTTMAHENRRSKI